MMQREGELFMVTNEDLARKLGEIATYMIDVNTSFQEITEVLKDIRTILVDNQRGVVTKI